MPDEAQERMLTSYFSIPSLQEERQALDVANSLMAVSGIGSIDTDVKGHSVTICYDPEHVSPGMIERSIEGTGYAVESVFGA